MSGLVAGTFAGMLPHSVVESEPFAILGTFVGINTIMYATLAIAKIMPKLHPTDWLPRGNRRSETRSIFPDADI